MDQNMWRHVNLLELLLAMLSRLLRLPWVLLLIGPIILFSPLHFTGKALFWGTPSLQFVPWRTWAWEVLQEGHLPLWNPLLGMGAPLVANYQSALFYPPNWLNFLFAAIAGPPGIAFAQTLLVTLHLIWASVGMALLVRRLGLNDLAQTVSGLAFGLCGYLVTRAGFLSINSAVAWLPWVILATTQLIIRLNTIWGGAIKRAGRTENNYLEEYPLANWRLACKPLLVLGFCGGMQLLAGHAQLTWYTLLLSVLWGGYVALRSGRNQVIAEKKPIAHRQTILRDRRIPYSIKKFSVAGKVSVILGAIGIAWLVSVTLSAVQLFPTGEYLVQSARASQVDYDFATTYSFWPWRFLTLLAPDLFGDPASGDYWGYGYYWEDSIYVGVLPLILAISAVGRDLNKRVREKGEDLTLGITRSQLSFFLVMITGVSFLLALGKNIPLFPWLYKNIPSFDMFQAPTRYTIWAEFSIALLAGIGAHSWKKPQGRSLYWIRLGVAGAVAIILSTGLTTLVNGYFIETIKPSFLRATAVAGFLILASGLLTLTAPEHDLEPTTYRKSSPIWVWTAGVFIAVDLLIAGWGQNPGIELSFYREASSTTWKIRNLMVNGRLFIHPEDVYRLLYERFFLASTFRSAQASGGFENLRATLLPNLGLLDGISMVNNFDPLVPARYQQWMDTIKDASPEIKSRMLKLMSISVVENVDDEQQLGIRFEETATLPRYRWVPCGQPVRNAEEALRRIIQGNVNIDREVIFESHSLNNPSICNSEAEAEVILLAEHPNQVRLHVSTDEPGYLVVADVWYPGWKAWVDGIPSEITRANFLFKAIFVTAGSHEVMIAYRPFWFYAGALVSLVAWITFGLLLVKKIS